MNTSSDTKIIYPIETDREDAKRDALTKHMARNPKLPDNANVEIVVNEGGEYDDQGNLIAGTRQAYQVIVRDADAAALRAASISARESEK